MLQAETAVNEESLSWDFVRRGEAYIIYLAWVSRKPNSLTESMNNILLESNTFASLKN